jgi:hypothetical protein
VIDGGSIATAPLGRLSELASQAVLVASEDAAQQVEEGRSRLTGAGFANVTTFTDKAPRPDEAPQGPRTAAA